MKKIYFYLLRLFVFYRFHTPLHNLKRAEYWQEFLPVSRSLTQELP